MANYQWKADTDYRSTTTLSHGVTPDDKTSWQTATVGTPDSGTYTYWYRDSNTTYAGSYQDLLSSRCAISITDSWNTSVDSQNNLTVTVTTTLNSIVRDDIRHPTGTTDQNTPGRIITVYRSEGGQQLGQWTDNQVATAHTIYAGPMVLASYTFTLAPGQDASRSSLFLHNKVNSPSIISWDEIGVGITFRNPLPANYIPGKTYDTAGQVWLSHNRSTNGHARLYNGSGWSSDMKTIGGDGVSTGDPPSIYNNGAWRNMRKIGQDA